MQASNAKLKRAVTAAGNEDDYSWLRYTDSTAGMLMQESNAKLKRAVEQKEVLLLAVREQLAVREKELAQSQAELAEQKGRCRSMEGIMNAEVASRERTERELRTAVQQTNAVQEQLDRQA